MYCAGKNDRFYKVGALDTVLISKSSLDVTKANIWNGNALILKSLSEMLQKGPDERISGYCQELVEVDSFEKSRIPLYRREYLTEGVYYSYCSFTAQVPDML